MKKTTDKNVSVEESYAQVCKYDARKDVEKVRSGLAVSIDDMLQTGIVKDAGETLDNNGIDNPERIIGRIRDIFDALDAQRIIKKHGRKPAKAQTEITDVTDANNN